ncbi:MAG: 16S rRNA (adenine(1518)-N(6)/adenine(1519)-N(6))-dimethyltransferase RsmA [Oscillospiraceae bacterium]|jgi:16S rRNA (adenine1518-N6/adenine1519-N6)-dimethyltransferase|nr:16S rRNA (adenine(1518)-N(6)/adenine(1519)-N(6))-dimethyltransferase RsmA [Oscillospiraceae bacterium]
MGELSELLKRHGFVLSKSLGQNFLTDMTVPRRIAAAASLGADTHVLEIGPGVGALTRELSARAGHVTAVELDRRLLPLLDETLADCANVTVTHGDILKLDLAELLQGDGYANRVACANLPYNITTPALTKLFDSGLFSEITVMIQREVAHRITAKPATSDYGAFSVYAQYHAVPEILFDVPPSSFLPPPKVTSSVVRMTLRSAERGTAHSGITDERFFFRIVRGAFGQRRKTLVNALAAALAGSHTKAQIAAAVADCGFLPTVRGEELGIGQFADLANMLLA